MLYDMRPRIPPKTQVKPRITPILKITAASFLLLYFPFVAVFSINSAAVMATASTANAH